MRATGTDLEQGTLPASAFSWHALLFHNDGNQHSHPFYTFTGVVGIQRTIGAPSPPGDLAVCLLVR
jgi:hypothetical protein